MDIPLDSDWPLPFHFNGQTLPKWSAQWHLCSLGDFLNGFRDDWDEFIGYKQIRHLQCRLDHTGTVESEDPPIFRICALEVLSCLISHQSDIMANLAAAAPEHSSAGIYQGLTDGLERMLHLTHSHGFSFWTSGGSQELAMLRDFMKSHQASDVSSAPHLVQRKSEQDSRTRFQLTRLRHLSQSRTLDKRLRTIIHQLP